MKIPVNRHYYSLVTENVDYVCQTKTAGRGGGVYVLLVLRGAGGGRPSRPNRGGVCILVFGGIDTPAFGVFVYYFWLMSFCSALATVPSRQYCSRRGYRAVNTTSFSLSVTRLVLTPALTLKGLNDPLCPNFTTTQHN